MGFFNEKENFEVFLQETTSNNKKNCDEGKNNMKLINGTLMTIICKKG